MFFYISQLFSFLVMPFTICLFLIGVGTFGINRSWGKRLVLTGFLLTVFFSNSYLSNWLMYDWEPPPKDFHSLPDYEVGIILTGVTNIDKTPKDRTYFNKGADRVTHAVQLYKMGKIKKILITGGLGFDPSDEISEAASLGDFMVWAGVKRADLMLETAAKNTRENAVYTQQLLKEKGILDQKNSSFLLITSAFHMKRAKACFVKTGLNPDTFPVDYYAATPKFNIKTIFQPSINAILVWHKLVKEWVGILAYKTLGYI